MCQRKHRARLRLPFRYRNIFGVLNTEQTMTFRRAAAVLCLAIIPMTLAGCGESEFKEGFDKGFDRSWKESFVKSCIKGAGPRVEAKMAADLCACMGDYMSERLTRAELANPVSERSEKIGEEATNACVAKLVPQTPG
jgi:hypothetical protein